MILTGKEDFENAILKGEKIKTSTVFYTGELAEVETLEIGAVIEKGGQKGIYAGEYERKPLVLSLEDLPEQKKFDDAIKSAPKGWRIPNRIEWLIMLENKEKLNCALKAAGGKKLSENDCYWSSSEYRGNGAWYVDAGNGSVGWYSKDYHYLGYVRCILI